MPDKQSFHIANDSVVTPIGIRYGMVFKEGRHIAGISDVSARIIGTQKLKLKNNKFG